MSSKGRKDKARYRSKLRKQQLGAAAKEADAEKEAEIIEGSADRLQQELIKTSGEKDQKVVRDERLEKMSDILLDYGKPIIGTIGSSDKAEYENAIKICMVFWNCAIMEESPKMRKELKKMLRPVMPDAESKSVVEYMLERKRQMYPNNKRLMMNYELADLPGGGFYLSVASTLDEETAKEYTENSQNMT